MNVLETQRWHGEFPKECRAKSVESLRYIIADCQAAIAANPTGEKAGHYSDTISYCGMELRRRGLTA